MRHIKNQTKFELKLLPLMLGKIFGGITAVFGVTTIVFIKSQELGWSLFPFALLGGVGILTFVLSDRYLAKRMAIPTIEKWTDANRKDMSLLSWTLLLLLAGLFLLYSYYLTK